MLKRFSSVVLVRLVTAVLQAVMLIWMARELGPVVFGSFAVALTTGSLLGVVLGLGATSQVLRLGESETDTAVMATLVRLRIVSAVMAGAGGLLVGRALGLGPDLSLVIALWVWAELVSELLQAVHFGHRRVGRANAVLVYRRVIPIGALATSVVWWPDTRWWALALGSAAAGVVALIVAPSLRRKRAPVGETISGARHYWASTVLVGLQTADVALVGLVSANPVHVGLYSAANRVTSPLNILTSSVLSLLTPELARATPSNRPAVFRRVSRVLWGVSATLLVVSPVVAHVAVFVLGEAYAGAEPILVGVTASVAVGALVQGNVSYLYAIGKAKDLTLARLWSVPIGLGLVVAAAFTGQLGLLACAPIASQCVQLFAVRRAVKRPPV